MARIARTLWRRHWGPSLRTTWEGKGGRTEVEAGTQGRRRGAEERGVEAVRDREHRSSVDSCATQEP